MTVLFVHTESPVQTLEDETFVAMKSLYPQALHFECKSKGMQEFRSYLNHHRPSIVISRQYLPRFLSTPNLIVSSSIPSRPLSWLLRNNVSVLSHSPLKTLHPHYLLPPLLKESTTPLHKPTCFLSVGPFHRSSHHHLALDAYSMLSKRIRNQYSLYFCGPKESQEDLDRLRLHGYGLSIYFVHDRLQIHNLLSDAGVVFRLGDSTQKNLSIDQNSQRVH